MGSYEIQSVVDVSPRDADSKQHSCLDFSEEPMSKPSLCSETVENLINAKEPSTFEQLGGCSKSRDNNACTLGSSGVMQSTVYDMGDGIEEACECGVDPGPSNLVSKELRICSNGGCSAVHICEAETDGLCSGKPGSLEPDFLHPSLDNSQRSVMPKHAMESPRKSFGRLEPIEGGNDLAALAESHKEGHIDDSFLINHESWKQTLTEVCESSQQSIPENALSAKCVKQDEGKDTMDINDSLIPVVLGHTKAKDSLLTNADENSGASIMVLEDIKTGKKLASKTCTSDNCIEVIDGSEFLEQRNDALNDSEVISSVCTEERNEDVNGSLSGQVANVCPDTLLLRSSQLLLGSLPRADNLSNVTTKDELNDPNWPVANEMVDDSFAHSSVLQCAHKSISDSHEEGFRKDDKIVGDLCEDRLADISDAETMHVITVDEVAPLMTFQLDMEEFCKEETFDDNTDLKAESSHQISRIEEVACRSEACAPMKGSSLMLDVPGLSGEVAIRVSSTGDAVNCLRVTDNEIKECDEAASVSELNCSDAAFSYSRRKGQKGKLSQKAYGKRIATGSKKGSRKKQLQENIDSIFKCARRKRSFYSKPARLTEWGSSGSIRQLLQHGDNLTSDEALNSAPRRSQDFEIIGKSSKDCSSRSLQVSSRKTQASSGGSIRIKVLFGKTGALNPKNDEFSDGADKSLSINDHGSKLHQATVVQIPKSAASVDDSASQNNNQDKKMLSRDWLDYLMDTKQNDKEIDCSVFCETSAGDSAYNCPISVLNKVHEESDRPKENQCLEAGTSPDSEVINSVPDAALAGSEHQGNLHHDAVRPKSFAAPADLDVKNKGNKKGKKKDVAKELKTRKNRRSRQKTESSALSSEIVSVSSFEKAASEIGTGGLNSEPQAPQQDDEDRISGKTIGRENFEAAKLSPSVDLQLVKESKSIGKIHASSKIKRHGLPKISECSGKEKSEFSKSRIRNASGDKKGQQNPFNYRKGMEESVGDQDIGRLESHQDIGFHATEDVTSIDTINNVGSHRVANDDMLHDGAVKENASTDSAWVRCDDCLKWRRISASLAESIDDNCRWVCHDNVDKDMANCSVPQEMSNEDINAELGMTQAEADAYDGDLNFKKVDKGERKRVPGNQKACFKAIKVNQFLHRNRKAQTIDEVMVCQCKPPFDGQLGCRDDCLNRMLNIECIQGTCPCGDLCSNQQFQKRKYVKFERFQSGKKGHGLKLHHDVRKGQFLIEYVGEVLDMQAYEARQKDYAANGQKHFYFMTLNGNEVIDAGVKGNLGRFINHSCEPNCRTEKWVVNGEICVGIFAIRNIKKGEEVTFDYNYVRVFGAAAKKCHCGSAHCRGYIGGDSLNGDIIVQSDSDEEYEEPVMLEDDDSVLEATPGICADNAEAQITKIVLRENVKTNDSRTNGQSSIATEIVVAKSHADLEVSEAQNLVGIDVDKLDIEKPDVEKLSCSLKPPKASLSSGDATIRPMVVVQQDVEGGSASRSFSSNQILETSSSTVSRLSSDSTDAEKKSKYNSGGDSKILRKSRPLVKTPRSSGSGKKEKGARNPVGGSKMLTQVSSKPQQQPNKSRVSTEISSSARPETVEGKLNELMDDEGGISKRKDSAKGYLKLLLLTAASRGSASNEGIQSNRDLSMILGALLKTKSRAVLVDIINKNGLQMLHNIMKQYRSDFKRIPILRKLLKVLEYLAVREILALEHIIRGPPCAGMESFRDSMLTLTEHDDKEVHQIARKFRDKWIPKHFRKPRYMNRDDGRREFQRDTTYNSFSPQNPPRHNHDVKPTEPVPSILPPLAPSASDNTSGVPQADGTKVRKRKSRWDQPAMKKEKKVDDTLLLQQPKAIERDSMLLVQDNQDDIPPGFSPSTRKPSPVPSKASPEYVIAHPQQKFQSRLPVSYGIPLNIMQEFGTPHSETLDTWQVAPGMPFHPFPPLPPFPRENRRNGPHASVNSTTANEHGPTVPCSGGDSIASSTEPDNDVSAHKRPRESSNDLGLNYFRQQKRNSPPWSRNGHGVMGNNVGGGGAGHIEPGFVSNVKLDNSSWSQGTGSGGMETTSRYSTDQQRP